MTAFILLCKKPKGGEMNMVRNLKPEEVIAVGTQPAFALNYTAEDAPVSHKELRPGEIDAITNQPAFALNYTAQDAPVSIRKAA